MKDLLAGSGAVDDAAGAYGRAAKEAQESLKALEEKRAKAPERKEPVEARRVVQGGGDRPQAIEEMSKHAMYVQLLEKCVADGIVTPDELTRINSFRKILWHLQRGRAGRSSRSRMRRLTRTRLRATK